MHPKLTLARTAVLLAGDVKVGTVFILHTTDIATDRVILEAISAFATVGLATGITADLPESAQVMLAPLILGQACDLARALGVEVEASASADQVIHAIRHFLSHHGEL